MAKQKLLGSHATHAVSARNERGSNVDFARNLRGFCEERNLTFV